jgi:hypothetical protein
VVFCPAEPFVPLDTKNKLRCPSGYPLSFMHVNTSTLMTQVPHIATVDLCLLPSLSDIVSTASTIIMCRGNSCHHYVNSSFKLSLGLICEIKKGLDLQRQSCQQAYVEHRAMTMYAWDKSWWSTQRLSVIGSLDQR